MKKRNWKTRTKIFLLTALKIPYLLLYRYDFNTRLEFTNEHPCLSILYRYLLSLISRELNLPVKICRLCGISYIPDHRTKNHQKHCPYGCIELNRRKNKQKAKSKYRKTIKGATKTAEYNERYQERKRNGQVSELPGIDFKLEEVERKLRAQIKFLYRQLNSDVDSKKLKQLDRILRKLSHRISRT